MVESVSEKGPLAGPVLPPLTSTRPITSDDTQTANTARAAGADLISRAVSTSGINGIGGTVDLTA
jgi:hypothetical protein